MSNYTPESLYTLINKHGYVYAGGVYKKARKSLNDYELAVEILPLTTLENTPESLPKLLALVMEVSNNWEELSNKESRDRNVALDEFMTKYIQYISQDEQVKEVDRRIWGTLYSATRENGDVYYVSRTGKHMEFEEAADTLADLSKSFVDAIIYDEKLGRTKRGNIFNNVLNNLIRDYPVNNNNFATVADLDNLNLSPTILKHFVELVTVKVKGEIIGYKLETRIKTTIADYLKVSAGVVGGTLKDIGFIEPMSNCPNTPCLKYIDLDSLCSRKGEYPAWNNFMDQFRVREAKYVFMAWIYSVFKAKNKGSQILTLHGKGSDGKTSVLKALSHYLGGSLGTINDKALSTDFGLESVIGRRLVVNADLKKPSLFHSETLHNITTGDPVVINRKFKSMYTSKVYAKMMICTNSAPNLHTNENNQIRRIIYVKFRELSKEELVDQGRLKVNAAGEYVNTANAETFVNDLIDQLPYFMHHAKLAYDKLCPEDNVIHLSDVMMGEIMALNDINTSQIEYFLNEGYSTEDKEDCNPSKAVNILTLFEDLSMEFGRELNKEDQFKVKNVLNNVFGLDNFSAQLRSGETRQRCISGNPNGDCTIVLVKK